MKTNLPASRNSFNGFTIVELLLVMVILAVLASMVLITYPSSQKRARDSQRRSDLKQYQTGLESYNNNNNAYPVDATAVDPQSLCSTIFPTSTPTCPKDPKDGASICSGSALCRYQYITDATGTVYVLYARLEIPISSAKPYFVSCSNGLSGEAAAPSGSTCPL